MIGRTIAFASPRCLIDSSSGAAIATADCLELLASIGFRCQAYCAASLDFPEEFCLEQVLAERRMPYESRKVTIGAQVARFLFAKFRGTPVTVFRNQFTRLGPPPREIALLLEGYERFLRQNRPEVVLTYGGGPVGDAIIDISKRCGATVVFGLHNFAYQHVRAFQNVDYVVVPSQFSRDWYRQRLGLDCHVLPNAIDFPRVKAADCQPQYLTLVNPQPVKGLFVFARIAYEICRRRPDIPILIIDSRGRGKALERTELDFSRFENLFGMANTSDPRKFYRVTKVLAMPSLWNESFGLAAAEAMINGIPVLASNRGTLPETVGEGGLVLDIPARYTPETTAVPTAEEVAPWVEAIERLWDDADFYRRQSEAALAWSARWRPEALRPLYETFFRTVHPQPGPPIVLKEAQAAAEPSAG